MNEEKKRRYFDGVFTIGKTSNFDKAHLRAYIGGDKYFFHGYEQKEVGGFVAKERIRHEVKEVWK